MLGANDADDYGLEGGGSTSMAVSEPAQCYRILLVLDTLFFSRSLVTEDEIRDGGHGVKVEYVIKL